MANKHFFEKKKKLFKKKTCHYHSNQHIVTEEHLLTY